MSSGAWESEVCRTQDWGWQDQMLSSGSVAHTYFCYPTSPCNNTKEEIIEMVKPGPLWRFTAGSQETRLTNSNKTRFRLDIKEEQLPIRMVKHWNKGPEMWWNLSSRRFSRPDWKKAWASWSKFIAAAVLSRTLEERPSEVPSNISYTMILSSRGLQCWRSINRQRSTCSIGYVVMTNLHMGVEIRIATL